MPAYVDTINKILSLGTIFLQIFILFTLGNFIFYKSRENKFLLLLKKYTFHLGFLVSLGAFLLSLFYSSIVGYPPCELCWMQRIFLYPQLILFTMELYKKDRSIVDFSIVFATIGSIISMYHVYVENGGTKGLACANINPASTTQISCAVRYIYEFGYITMPIMALTISIFIILILSNYKYMAKVK